MSKIADICLVLEGTYPYVTGGVSSWVHQLIDSLAEFTFALAVILPDDEKEWQPKYDVPANVLEIKQIFLHEQKLPETHKQKLRKEAWEDVELFHNCPFNNQKLDTLESVFYHFFDAETRGIAPVAIAERKEAWNILNRLYENHSYEESFIDYFWTFRFMHQPIFKILTSELPRAWVYHPVSTGYAGLLAVVGKIKYKRPLILTEHGIYTRERRFEISRADWIYENDVHKVKVRHSQSSFKELWNKMFGTLSHLTYDFADLIVTLSRKNQEFQINDGAKTERMKIIPNGIDVDAYRELIAQKKTDCETLTLGFMGRVVSIKDVKTFIRACKNVADEIRNLKIYIMGPVDEEEIYYHECVQLVEFLGLADMVEFTGKINVKEYYPKIDILVLTSLSEAQPLVILEANSMGIPVVATDVGACREMLYGRTEDDRALGKSGFIAGITNSEEIAASILKIWRSESIRKSMAEAGKQRVQKYYNLKDLDNKYRKIYDYYCKI